MVQAQKQEQRKKSPPKLARADRLRGLAVKLLKPELDRHNKDYKDNAGFFVYNSRYGDFGCSQLPTMQSLLFELRGETVEARAQELLTVLHNQWQINPELAIRVLQAVALFERAKALGHEYHADVCDGLANAISGSTTKPRELDQQKIALFLDVCTEILAIPQTWAEYSDRGRIEINEENRVKLTAFIQEKLGLDAEEAGNALWTLHRMCQGPGRILLEEHIEEYLHGIMHAISEHGKYEMYMSESDRTIVFHAAKDDTQWSTKLGKDWLKPEKEIEFRKLYARACLEPKSEQATGMFHGMMDCIHDTVKGEAIRLGFYAEEKPNADPGAVAPKN